MSIPPLSEAFIPVRIDGAHTGSEWGVLELMTLGEVHANGVLVTRTRVDLQKQTAALRVLNVTREQKVIRRGATLASCSCVTTSRTSTSSGEVGTVRMASPVEPPPHLEQLCHRCTEGLSVSKKEIACQLLCEFSDLFFSGPGDL